jgi:hypothetical protein
MAATLSVATRRSPLGSDSIPIGLGLYRDSSAFGLVRNHPSGRSSLLASVATDDSGLTIDNREGPMLPEAGQIKLVGHRRSRRLDGKVFENRDKDPSSHFDGKMIDDDLVTLLASEKGRIRL